MDAQERQNLKDFMENVIYAFKNKVHTSRVFPKLKQTDLKYKSDDIVEVIADSDNIKLVILTDTASMSDNLQNMVKRFQANFSKEPEIIDLTRIKIAGGCLGCVKCGMDNECVYDGKDDVRSVYEDKLKKADIIVFAQKLTRYSKLNVSQPETCLGVGAGKIFRDEIWGNLRFIFSILQSRSLEHLLS